MVAGASATADESVATGSTLLVLNTSPSSFVTRAALGNDVTVCILLDQILASSSA